MTKTQNTGIFTAAVVFLQRQRCFNPLRAVIFLRSLWFQLIFVLQDTRIRVIEKESSGQKSRKLSVTNPSPDGSETLIFSTDTSDELEDWLDALHQHLFDQSECDSAKDADAFKSTCARSTKTERFGKAKRVVETDRSLTFYPSLSPPLAENQASGYTAATS